MTDLSAAALGLGATALGAANAATRYTRPNIALLGDSRVQLSHGNSGTSYYFNDYGGFAGQLMKLTGGRVSLPQRLNFGVGGITSADMLGKSWSYILANTAPSGTQAYQGNNPQAPATWPSLTPLESCAQSDANGVILLVSTNDRLNGMTADQSISNIQTAITRLRQANKQVFLIAEEPRGDTTYTSKRLTGTQLAYHMKVAQWARNVKTNGVYVIDPWAAMAQVSSSTGDAILGMTYDGLHHSAIGAWVVASVIAPVINAVYPATPQSIPMSGADVGSTDNPYGCWNGNPTMSYATGSHAPAVSGGETASGLLPQYWADQGSNLAGLTITYSSVIVNGIPFISAAISGTPSAANPRLDITANVNSAFLTGIAAGDVIQSSGLAYLQAGFSGVYQMLLFQGLTNSGGGAYVDQRTVGNANFIGALGTVASGSNGQFGGTFVTDSYLSDGTPIGAASVLKWRIYFTQSVAVSATVLIGPTGIRNIKGL